MKTIYSNETGELRHKFSSFNKILIIALSFLMTLTSSKAISQAATPCAAHRWNAGDGWRINTTTSKWEAVVLSSPNLQPKGIVRCASSAETESGLQKFKGVFHAADNPAILSGGASLMDCFNQGNGTFGNAVSKPTEGEDIVWLNFDIRPLAGTYQFQIVSNELVGWALFYSNKPAPVNGVTPGTVYPAGGGLSGDCSDLSYASVNGHGGCGLSGNGWSTITAPSFLKPTNYYLAMWMASPSQTTFPGSMNLVYKSRFGCGGATCALEYLNKNLTCADNGYTVCANYGGSAGKWGIVDNAVVKANSYTYTTYKQDGTTVVATGSSNNLSTTPLSFILGTVADDGAVLAKVCATYGDGHPYNISLVPDGSYTVGSNYVACTSGGNFSGTGITKQTVTATATPTALILKKNIISSVLHASVAGGSGSYAYSWQQLTLQGNTSFTNTNTSDATFTILNINIPLALQYDFKVTVTDKITGCVATALVSVLLVPTDPPCTITGTLPGCPGGLQQFTGPTDPDITVYEWKISEYGQVPTGSNPPSDGSTIDGSSSLQTVKVKPGSSCKVAYRITVITTAGLTKATCFMDVQIEDKTAPVLSGQGGPITIECPAIPSFTPPTAKDNCDEAPVITWEDKTIPGTCAGNYAITRTWTAKDACGNTSDPVSQTITVLDTKAPVIGNVPADVTAECDNIPAFGTPTASDNCDPAPSLTYVDSKVPGNCPQNYQLVRTWTAKDACGNTSAPASQTITVQDTKAPVFGNFPADVTAECDAIPAFGTPTAKDNCDATPALTYVDSKVAGSCPQNYKLVRTWTATDACGNKVSKAQTISAQDTKAPVFGNFPADVTAECDNVPEFGTPTATDNCDATPSLTYVDSKVAGNCPQNYQLVRTWTATDDCGNKVSKAQTITVQDTKAPVLTCAANKTLPCGSQVVFTEPTATDNCDPAPVISVVSTTVSDNTTTRTWKATDACGNVSATCSQSITVEYCNHTFPTQTTCCNYVTNTASPQTKICYTVSGSLVDNAIPGVFFYYSTLVAPAASFKIDVEQSNNKGSFKLFAPQNTPNVRLFTMNCNSANATATISGGNATLNITGATPGATYIVSVKYDTKSIIGSSTGGGLPTVTYKFKSFTTVGGIKALVPNSIGTMDAVANCSDNTPIPGSCTIPAPTIATRLPETPVVNGQLEVTAFPNPAPARGSFNLKIVSPVSGTAVIQYFNVNGSKVQEVKKVVQAHVTETVKFEGSNSITGAILYKVSVEGHSVKGLVMRLN